MGTKSTYRNRGVFISTTAQNAEIADATTAAGLTYTEVKGVGNVSSYGPDTNLVSYNTYKDLVAVKQKGNTDGGSPTIECARDDSDEGQQAMRAAGAPDVTDAYVVKIVAQDGSIDYLRGVITGPINKGGGNEDFDLDTYTVGVSQPLHQSPSEAGQTGDEG